MRNFPQRRAALFVSLLFLFVGSCASARGAEEKEVTVFFTGQAYAALYPCECQLREGGVARRAAALKELRGRHPGLLVVEAGALFGSGDVDMAAVNLELDKERTRIYLAALKAMGYDALLLSGQEFIFGASFLGEFTDHPFVSSNVSGVGRPHIIKDVDGVRVGVLGVTDRSAASHGAADWKAPVPALEQGVRDLKKAGAEVIVVLSSLCPKEDAAFLKDVKGIDVVINGAPSYGSVVPKTVEGAVWVSTWWQAKQAGLLRLRLGKDKKVEVISCDAVALGPSVADDPDVSRLLPACMQDTDCRPRPGLVVRCERSQDLAASRCVYTQPSPLDVTVIAPKECPSCQTEAVLRDLEALFGKMRVRRLDAAEAEAQKIIEEVQAATLPLYVFEAQAEAHEFFPLLSNMVEKKRVFYVLKPGMGGVSVFLKRPVVPRRLDVFLTLGYSHLAELAMRLKELGAKHKDVSLNLHFLAAQNAEGAFLAQGGLPAIEEYKRLACLEATQPEVFYDYLACRAADIESGWWERCAEQTGVDAGHLRGCAAGPEGDTALAQKIALTRELEMAAGPALLVNNRDIYGMVNVPSLEELEEKLGLGSPESENK